MNDIRGTKPIAFALKMLTAAPLIMPQAMVNAAIPANVSPLSPNEILSFPDVADLFGDAPLVLRARIAEAIPVPMAGSPGTPQLRFRFYVEADVTSLIRGREGLAPRIAYLADVAADARGKAPKLKKMDVMLAAFPVEGKPGSIRLAARDGQQRWGPYLEARIRNVVGAGLGSDAPPHVTGISGAFHVAGTLPGESETQIFVKTAERRPVSLSILRRPNETPRWSVAFGEIVDEAAAPPVRDTLTWYRLACFLPPALPGEATAELSPSDAEAARADYAIVVEGLGTCIRKRGQATG